MSSPQLPDVRPSQALRAYTAGIVDGEGSIQINPTRSGRNAKRSYWSLTVQVSSVGPGFLEALRDEWGGIGTCTYFKSRGNQKARRVCNWRLYSAQAGWLLEEILPFLRLKREHAQVALEFRSQVVAQFRNQHVNSLTPAHLEHRRQLANRMRELNARTGKSIAGPFPSEQAVH